MPLNTRQAQSSADIFLGLIANPAQSQLQAGAIYSAIVWAFAVAGSLFVLFCLLRPHIPNVYAPRAKYADKKHAPLVLSKSPLAWVRAIHVKEEDLVEKIGLDAVIFLRFVRMMRNIFVVFALLGVAVVVPVTLTGGKGFYENYNNIATLLKLTPQYMFGEKFWFFVLCAWVIQLTVIGFIWWNYRAVLRLKRNYFASDDYQKTLFSRTLLVTHIPDSSRTDAGLAQLIDQAKHTDEAPRAAIGRNVKELPQLLESHDKAVEKLEKVLAKYLRNANQLPSERPTCKVFKEDRTQYGREKVDAIDYLTERIRTLAKEIEIIRQTTDQRNPMSYGFASYFRIEDAHAVAFAARKKGPRGSHIQLAPKPNDVLWQNIAMTKSRKRRRQYVDGFWMVLLTVIYIAPNILTSVFLSDLSHLGQVWPAFQTSLNMYKMQWSIVQGILAPLVQILVYLLMPPVFRRIYVHAGDISKTKRDRHVTSRLYAFFVFNNLIVFSVFGSIWRFVTTVIEKKDDGVWEAISQARLFGSLMIGLCNMSTFWLTFQMQRNLLAAFDLVQSWTLLWNSLLRKLGSPTPREQIKLTAPQPFDYAVFYNHILFAATVGLCYGTLQPLILPITAFYIAIEYWWKKYLLQYVYITKNESGGLFWNMVVNRLLFATLLGNAVVALMAGARGVGEVPDPWLHANMLYAMIPLPFIVGGFKWYCIKTFDVKINYYSTTLAADLEVGEDKSKRRRNERVGIRFGHPALYQTLITPMVNAKAKHLLPEIYKGRLDPSHGTDSTFGDIFMSELDSTSPGKLAGDTGGMPFEMVNDSQLDFENFMRRAEFREEFGGDGELYDNSSYSGSASLFSKSTAAMGAGGAMAYPRGRNLSPSPASSRQSSNSRPDTAVEGGTSYQQGYHQAYHGSDENLRLDSRSGVLRSVSPQSRNLSPLHSPRVPSPNLGFGGRSISPYADNSDDESRRPLASSAAGFGVAPLRKPLPRARLGNEGGFEDVDTGYTSYDDFRRGR